MRLSALSLAPIALLTLSACGEGGAIDEGVKTQLREQLVSTCNNGMVDVPEGIELDREQVCNCVADKVLAGKSVQDLVANPPTGADEIAGVKQCLREIGPPELLPYLEG
ncbi:hypothetical protein [uncultured Sphingorhabdus sp.]|uniref:hypothetical protein n=1 Tax=uncultured Sphingorhabdus sp. TaxID=1686106 RepID=UPI00262B5DD6|nr:hypothetical protein [uncultured Sphingorhabdus sp.]HMS21316.1 hypothetical protein [Sphingorhabdus sp.]